MLLGKGSKGQDAGFLVCKDGNVWMEAQKGGGHLGGYGAKHHIINNLGFPLAAGGKEDFFCLHNGAYSHGNRLPRHLGAMGKKAGIGLDGGLGKVYHMGKFREMAAGLVKPNVAVVADAQQLDIHRADSGQQFLILAAFLLGILGLAAGNMGIFLWNVYFVKEVLVHKITVALVVFRGEAQVFIQVYGLDLGEVQVALLVPVDELVIHPHGAGAGSEAHHAVGLQDDLGGEDIGRLAAHGPIIFGHVDLHSCVRSFIFYDDRIDHR